MTNKNKAWIVVDIGCIECGVTSSIVGVYGDEDKANSIADELKKKFQWRHSGQNDFEVFPMPEMNVLHDEYKQEGGN